MKRMPTPTETAENVDYRHFGEFDNIPQDAQIKRLRSEILELRRELSRMGTILGNLLATERDLEGRPFVKRRNTDGRCDNMAMRRDPLA